MSREYWEEQGYEQSYGEGFDEGFIEATELMIRDLQDKLKKFKENYKDE